MSLRTGQKVVTKLRKYINGYPTTEVKDNATGDTNYIAPYTDEESCPKYEIETVVTPTPSPVGTEVVPAPTGVTEEPPPDQSTVCTACFTRDVAENECRTYTISHPYFQNQPGVDPAFMDLSYSYKNCENGEIIEGELSSGGVANVNSLTRPDTVFGPTINITEGQVVAGYEDIDINKYHYLASNCYDSEDRHLRSITQFNVGDVVKTANSTCCWEITQLVSPRVANEIIFNTASDKFNSCADCCDISTSDSLYGNEPTKTAVITGTNASLSHSPGFAIPVTKVFQVTSAGSVEIKLTLQLTTGNYIQAAARILKTVGVTKQTIVEFPLQASVIPYVENKAAIYGGLGGDVVQLKTVNLDAGTYKIEIDPLKASSNAFGSVTVTVNPK